MLGPRRRDLRRHRYSREPKTRFILYCEGRNTEPAYFKAVRQAYPSSLIEIETVPNAGVPYTLARSAIEKAKELKLNRRRRRALNSFEQSDEIWAVFDRDVHPRFEEAINLCKAHNVNVARSIPCFELWLILHLEDFDKPDGRYAVQAHLEKLLPGYERSGSKIPNCDLLIEGIELAEDRALAQLARRSQEGSEFNPPSTTAGRLTRSIRVAAQKSV